MLAFTVTEAVLATCHILLFFYGFLTLLRTHFTIKKMADNSYTSYFLQCVVFTDIVMLTVMTPQTALASLGYLKIQAGSTLCLLQGFFGMLGLNVSTFFTLTLAWEKILNYKDFSRRSVVYPHNKAMATIILTILSGSIASIPAWGKGYMLIDPVHMCMVSWSPINGYGATELFVLFAQMISAIYLHKKLYILRSQTKRLSEVQLLHEMFRKARLMKVILVLIVSMTTVSLFSLLFRFMGQTFSIDGFVHFSMVLHVCNFVFKPTILCIISRPFRSHCFVMFTNKCCGHRPVEVHPHSSRSSVIPPFPVGTQNYLETRNAGDLFSAMEPEVSSKKNGESPCSRNTSRCPMCEFNQNTRCRARSDQCKKSVKSQSTYVKKDQEGASGFPQTPSKSSHSDTASNKIAVNPKDSDCLSISSLDQHFKKRKKSFIEKKSFPHMKVGGSKRVSLDLNLHLHSYDSPFQPVNTRSVSCTDMSKAHVRCSVTLSHESGSSIFSRRKPRRCFCSGESSQTSAIFAISSISSQSDFGCFEESTRMKIGNNHSLMSIYEGSIHPNIVNLHRIPGCVDSPPLKYSPQMHSRTLFSSPSSKSSSNDDYNTVRNFSASSTESRTIRKPQMITLRSEDMPMAGIFEGEEDARTSKSDYMCQYDTSFTTTPMQNDVLKTDPDSVWHTPTDDSKCDIHDPQSFIYLGRFKDNSKF